MTKTIVTCILSLCAFSVFAQDCSNPQSKKYKHVMNDALAENYTECPVNIQAVFYQQGFLRGYKKPRKIKKMYFFQCLGIGQKPSVQGFTNQPSGDVFYIEKDQAETILSFEEGDTLNIIGTTYIHNLFGHKTVYFKVQKIEKI